MGIPLDVALQRRDRVPALLYDIVLMEGNAQRTEPQSVAEAREASDAVLVSSARTAGFEAFEELVRRYRNDVFRLCYHFTRNREEAWDLSQEAFIKAYSALARFRGEASFKTWLLRIAANQCKDFLKKRRLPTVGFDDALRADGASSSILEPDHAVEAEEIGRAIESAIQGLPLKHRTAFILREYEGMTYEEMAHVMDCNLGTVMSRLHHARRKLQRRLSDMGIAPGGSKKEGNRYV